MNTFAIFIQAFLVQRRRALGKPQSSSHCRAEAQLLHKETVAFLTKSIDRTADDTFIRLNGDIIDQSPRDIDRINSLDLLQSLAFPGQSLILTQSDAGDDVVWTNGQAVGEQLQFFWPYPVNASNLEMSSHKGHFKRTRREPVLCDRVAVQVPDTSMAALTKWLKTGKSRARAIVTRGSGVTVIFKADAIDYASWSAAVRDLKATLAMQKIECETISLSTLVPISQEARGPGALLFLA